MGCDVAHLAAALQVPPDQPAVVTAGNDRLAREANAGDVAAVIGQLAVLRRGLRCIQLVNLSVRAGDDEPARVRHTRDGEQNVAAGDLADTSQIARLAWRHADL